MFTKAGDSETRAGLGQKKQQESPGGAASLSGTSENGGRCRGLAQDKLLLPVAPLVASLLGTLRVEEMLTHTHALGPLS